MIEIEMSDSDIEQAKTMANDLGVLKNSITNGAGNVVGYIGEIAFRKIRPDAVHADCYEYDFISNGIKVDVKSKKCSSEPLGRYDCSISDYNTSQDCDVYLFTRVLSDLSKCWVVGWYYKDEYMRDARYIEAGTVDESNGMTFKCNTWNMPIKQLRQL